MLCLQANQSIACQAVLPFPQASAICGNEAREEERAMAALMILAEGNFLMGTLLFSKHTVAKHNLISIAPQAH